MPSSDLRSRMDAVFQAFWSSGITEPVSVIEQISYLLFIKYCEQLAIGAFDRESLGFFLSAADEYRWSTLKLVPPEDRLEYYRETIFPYWQADRVPFIPNPFACGDAVLLMPSFEAFDSTARFVDAIPLSGNNLPTMSAVWAELLDRMGSAGRHQFRTPPLICEVMAELAEPGVSDRIFDPVAGTGGLLLAVQQLRLRATATDDRNWIPPELAEGDGLRGLDLSPTTARLGVMTMLMNGLRGASFTVGNALAADVTDQFDVILAHPPFGGTVDAKFRSTIPSSTLRTADLNHLLMERFLDLLAPGGRCTVIVPDSLLSAGSKAAKELRRRLLSEFRLEAVISLPAGSFRPYTGIKTAILVLHRSVPTDKVWYFDITDDLQGSAAESSKLRLVPEALRRLRNSDGGRQLPPGIMREFGSPWEVSIDAIEAEDYVLEVARYRRDRLVERPAEDPAGLIRQIRALGRRIDDHMQNILDHIEVPHD